MIRRRAARVLLCSLAVPVVFGCSAATTTSTAPNHAAIGVPVEHTAPTDQVLAAARVAAPATTAPSPTVLVIPAPEPVPAAPENADANEMQPVPATTAAPAAPIAPRRTATAPAASTAAPAAEPFTPVGAIRLDAAAAADFAARTNSLRASLGLGALSRNAQLDSLAAGWARELASSGRLRHSTIPDRVVATGWNTAGENVGVGGSVASVHSALVNSPGHYANLAGAQYTAFGIAVAIGDDGRLWVCEVFAG